MKFGRDKTPPPRRRVRAEDAAESSATKPTLSYQPRRRGNATGEAVRRTGRSWLQRLGLIILILAVFVSLVNVLSLSGNAKVLPLNSGQSLTLHSQTEYQDKASKILASSAWNGNKITVDTAEVSREMQRAFPELTDVSVSIPLLARRPVVYVEPAQPAMILVSSQGAFLLDSSGRALLRAKDPAGLKRPNLPVLADQSNLSIRVNDHALPATTVDYIRTIVAQLDAKQYKVASLTLSGTGSQLDVRVEGQPYTVKFNLHDNDARAQAGTFIATDKYLKARGITPAQYIDVRVEGRAYYQ